MRRNEGGEKWKKEREGQGGEHVQSDPGDPERRADKLHARPLGSLPLPLSDDTTTNRHFSAYNAPNRLTKCFKGQL